MRCIHQLSYLVCFTLMAVFTTGVSASEKQLAYIVSDLRIPFWNIMWKGARERADTLGYQIEVYSAENSPRKEIENTVAAINSGVDGIILSPTNSSAAVTVLKLARKANIPVVISDIGAQEGEFVSYIKSNNIEGAYHLGQILVRSLKERGWDDGTVGIIAIPQRRENGKARTKGFLQALQEGGVKSADIHQQEDFSYQETYDFTSQLIASHADLRAIWLQGSDRYQGALDAIKQAGREGEVLMICFDAEPEFIDMIKHKRLVGAGMQQPFLMGEKAVGSMDDFLQGKDVPELQKLEVLAVSTRNIETLLPVINRNVLGLESE